MCLAGNTLHCSTDNDEGGRPGINEEWLLPENHQPTRLLSINICSPIPFIEKCHCDDDEVEGGGGAAAPEQWMFDRVGAAGE